MAENGLGEWEIIGDDSNTVQEQSTQGQPTGTIPQFLGKVGEYIPGPIKTAGRLVAGPAARIAETALGFPGFIEDVATQAVSGLTGMEAPKFPGVMDIFNYATGQGPLETSGQLLPTPQDIRKNITQRFTGEALEPQSKIERVEQEALNDLFQLSKLGGKKIAGALVGTGTAIKEGVDWLMGSDKSEGFTLGDALKSAVYIGGGIAPVRNAAVNRMRKGFQLVDKLAEKAKPGNANKFINSINTIESRLKNDSISNQSNVEKEIRYLKNLVTQPVVSAKEKKSFVEKGLKSINDKYDKLFMEKGFAQDLLSTKDAAKRNLINESNKLLSGKNVIDPDKLVKANKAMNAYIKQWKGKPEYEQATNYIKQLKGAIGETMETFSKDNPELVKTWKNSNALFNALNEKSDITNWFNKNVTLDKANHPLLHVLLYGTKGKYIPHMLAGIGVASAGRWAANSLDLAMRDPQTRSLYLNTLRYGLQGNTNMANKLVKQLDNRLKDTLPMGDDDKEWQIVS